MTNFDFFTITNALIAVNAIAIAVHFKFFVRKLLIALGYPKLRVIHPQLGIYDVGSIQVRLSNDLPATQIFYPVGVLKETTTKTKPTTTKQKEFVPYFRPEAVKGFSDFLYKLSNKEGIDWILQMLREVPHPLSETYGDDPLQQQDSNNKPKKFPLVLMSNGLGGCMEMYTEICSQLASLGTIVVAPEHEDTSGSYAVKTNPDDGTKEDIYFEGPDKSTPYSRKKMQDLRGPGIRIRVDELTAIYDHILEGWDDNDDSGDSIALAHSVLATCDPLKLHLVGHSFGGVTQLLAAQRWAEERALLVDTTEKNPSSPPPILPLSLTVCDSWNFALTDEQIAKGIPSRKGSGALPILSFLSEEWTTFEERWATLEFLKNSRDAPNTCQVESYFVKHAVHNSFSDAEAWFPTPIAKVDGTRGKEEDRHATINAVVAAFAKLSGLVESIIPTTAGAIFDRRRCKGWVIQINTKRSETKQNYPKAQNE
jgi:dienelactone hydrolase